MIPIPNTLLLTNPNVSSRDIDTANHDTINHFIPLSVVLLNRHPIPYPAKRNMISIPITAAGLSAVPVALKAIGELHRHTVLQANGNNNLARQGNGTPTARGEGEKLARQRAAGVAGGLSPAKQAPKYLDKVPSRGMAGDDRVDYLVGGLGNATSSRGNIIDVLEKVPQRTVGGSADYKRASRPTPSRSAGFGNQSYTP